MSSPTQLKNLMPGLTACLMGLSIGLGWPSQVIATVASSAPFTKQFKARYVMPVDAADVQLIDVATFELKGYTVDLTNEADGQAAIEYQMPVTLLGYEKSAKLFMTEKREQNMNGKTVVIREFSGRNGDAICAGPWSKMRCDVKFDIQPDLKALQALLSEMGDLRAADRMIVARRFGNEPIGTTEVE